MYYTCIHPLLGTRGRGDAHKIYIKVLVGVYVLYIHTPPTGDTGTWGRSPNIHRGVGVYVYIHTPPTGDTGTWGRSQNIHTDINVYMLHIHTYTISGDMGMCGHSQTTYIRTYTIVRNRDMTTIA